MLWVRTCCVIYRLSFGTNISDSKACIIPAAGLTMYALDIVAAGMEVTRMGTWGCRDPQQMGVWAPASTLGGLDSGQVLIRW